MSDLDQYKLDVAIDYKASEEFRRAANEDMRFIGVDGGMWENYLTDTHNNNTKRARLEFDITSDHVLRYVGEQTLNRANVTYTPDDKSTSDEDSELLNGVYRADFKDNDGQISQDNAVLEMATCGFGAYKLSAKFIDEEDPENEHQEIIFEPIHNAYNHVMFDSNSKRIDKADARRVTNLTAYTMEEFEIEWPDKDPSSAYTPETYSGFAWSTNSAIYIAERYEVKIIKEKVQVWQNIISNQIRAYNEEEWELVGDELKALGWEFVRERKINRRTIMKTVFSGQEILEDSQRIAGKYLPIIPLYGFRTFVDNTEHSKGLVRPMKDANRTFNSMVSKMAEASAGAADNVPVLSRKQVEGLEDKWADNSLAYKVLNDLVDANGNPVPSGPLGYLQSKQVDPNTVGAIEIISNFTQRITGGAPQDTIDPTASGKAINALKKRENLNTQVMTDNKIQSVKHSGRVYRSMAGDIYTRSQMKKIIGIDGKSKIEQLNVQSLDPQTGNPIQLNDLSRGKFSVDVEVGPQYESQKEATIESIESVIEKIGENSPYFAPLIAMWMENITGTGLDPLKKFNRNLMLKQGLVEPETPEEEQMLQSLQEQTDPQEELVKAAANQQNAEAKNLEASAGQKYADAQNKQADSQLKKAQAAEKVVDIGIKRTEQTLRRLVQIPANRDTG